MHNFLDELLDALMDVPINWHECGSCAITDLLSYVLWAANGYETLDCANRVLTLLLGEC